MCAWHGISRPLRVLCEVTVDQQQVQGTLAHARLNPTPALLLLKWNGGDIATSHRKTWRTPPSSRNGHGRTGLHPTQRRHNLEQVMVGSSRPPQGLAPRSGPNCLCVSAGEWSLTGLGRVDRCWRWCPMSQCGPGSTIVGEPFLLGFLVPPVCDFCVCISSSICADPPASPLPQMVL
jgi:hypothetical protein